MDMLDVTSESRRKFTLDLASKRRFALSHIDVGCKPWETLANLGPQEARGPGTGQGKPSLEERGLPVEVVSEVKQKRWSSGRLHDLLATRADQPRLDPQLEDDIIDISKARIDKPDANIRIRWSSLGALLLYFMGGDDKTGSKEKVAWFLNQAKATFEKMVECFEELHEDRSSPISIDEIHIKAFQEQLKAWPKGEALSLNQAILETPGVGVTANMESDVHVFPPHENNGNVFLGTVLCVPLSKLLPRSIVLRTAP